MDMIAIHLLTLVGFTRIGELFPVLAPLHLGKLAFALAGLMLVLTAGRSPLGELIKTPLLRHVLLLLGLAGLSVPFSVWRSGAFESFEAVTKTIFIFVTLVVMSRRAGAGVLRTALVLGVMLLSGMMVIEKGTGRAFVSATYDANDLALLFVMFLPVLGAEGLVGRGLMRLAAWGAVGTSLIAMTLTQSRGGLIALGVMGLHMVFASRRKVPLMLLACMAGAVFYFYADASFWDRFAMVGDADADYNVSAKTGRLELWKSGLSMILRNPLLGVGVGQFAPANFMYGNGVYLTAHNSYIQMTTELGIVALFVYLGLFRQVSRLATEGSTFYEDDKVRKLRWLAVRYGLTAYMTGICFLSDGFSIPIFCFLALVATMGGELHAMQAARAGVEVVEQASPAGRGGSRRGGSRGARGAGGGTAATALHRRSASAAAAPDMAGR